MQAAHSRLLLAAMMLIGGVPARSTGGSDEASHAYTPLGIVRTTELTFPSRLMPRYVDIGETRVMIMVNTHGQLVDWFVTGYTHPLFAKEVLDALQKWRFKPAVFHGQPIDARTEIRFEFKRTGVVRVVPVEMGVGLLLKDGQHREVFRQQVCKMEELDAPLDAVVEIAPMPPDRLGAISREGRVVVDYFIDVEGKVRMPLVISSDDDAFTQSVLLALSEWRYATPMHDGRPVMTRVWRQFEFRPIESAGNAPAAARIPDRT